MRFLIQKIDREVRHDFSFTLLESIRFQTWLVNDPTAFTVKYVNCKANDNVWFFKPFHEHYVPVGSVEFVLSWMKRFGIETPTPINVPEELFGYADRGIFNGPHYDMEDILDKRFVKSNDNIKGFKEVIDNSYPLPKGNYQFSELIDIDTEWRAFVYQGKLVGLQNYSGNFTKFPNVNTIKEMIKTYKSAPVAYTLDVAVGESVHHKKYGFFVENKTFVIEVHDFFSCGLYGFTNHNTYPHMLYRWFHEYLKKV